MSTKIPYVHETWNPVTGCTKISPGCRHCYAERMAHRLKGRYGYPRKDPFGITYHEDLIQKFLNLPKYNSSKIKKRVLVCSMGDLFHHAVPRKWIETVFSAARENKSNDCLFLTKRPLRMVQEVKHFFTKIPEHFWFGTSAENQHQLETRVPHLLSLKEMGAPVLFISVEPMLSGIDVRRFLTPIHADDFDGLGYGEFGPWKDGLDWIVCGGESGSGSRSLHPQWVRDLRDQCIEGETPFYFKQWGAWFPAQVSEPNGKDVIRLDLKGRDLSFLPHLWCEADAIMIRAGAKKTGCVLNGREWKDFPRPKNE